MENKLYRVEFNTSGFYSGQGVWECLDEAAKIVAENPQEAIELCIDWMSGFAFDNRSAEDYDREYSYYEAEYSRYAWRAAEIMYDDDGYLCDYEWITREAE